jgi:hypothetical protein
MLGFLLEVLMLQKLSNRATKMFVGTVAMFDNAMSRSRQDDPVYKKNVRELIERNRRFEKSE